MEEMLSESVEKKPWTKKWIMLISLALTNLKDIFATSYFNETKLIRSYSTKFPFILLTDAIFTMLVASTRST